MISKSSSSLFRDCPSKDAPFHNNKNKDKCNLLVPVISISSYGLEIFVNNLNWAMILNFINSDNKFYFLANIGVTNLMIT